MRIGIVGSAAEKFDARTEVLAKQTIRGLLKPGDVVISGGCHLGGIDIWAAEIGREMGLEVVEYLPDHQTWQGGYKERNIKIAKDCERCVCITVKDFPSGFRGERMFRYCYHCNPTRIKDHHIKSGGCWTMKQAKKFGKSTQLIVID